MNPASLYFDAGPSQYREEVIRLSLAVHTDEEVADSTTSSKIELDLHEHGLKLDIMRSLVYKPLMGMKALRRRGEYTVYVPIGQRLVIDRKLTKQRHTSCDLVVPENDEFCTLDRLQRVVEQACREVGISLVSGVVRQIHDNKRLRTFTFVVRY